MYKALFFDLDGTLLDTIHDIGLNLNLSLREAGIPLMYSIPETRGFIGKGTDCLLKRALGDEYSSEFENLKRIYMKRYAECDNSLTKPMPGIEELLMSLKKQGMLLFVSTNKPHHIATKVVASFFPNVFDGVKGILVNGDKPKPDPHQVNEFIDEYGLNRRECLFVGDSLPDLLTAENAGIDCCIVAKGYGDYGDLRLKKAKYIVDEASGVAKIAL